MVEKAAGPRATHYCIRALFTIAFVRCDGCVRAQVFVNTNRMSVLKGVPEAGPERLYRWRGRTARAAISRLIGRAGSEVAKTAGCPESRHARGSQPASGSIPISPLRTDARWRSCIVTASNPRSSSSCRRRSLPTRSSDPRCPVPVQKAARRDLLLGRVRAAPHQVELPQAVARSERPLEARAGCWLRRERHLCCERSRQTCDGERRARGRE